LTLEVREGLSAAQVKEEASLFYDLGFDSLAFENLAAKIKARFDEIDLTPWFDRVTSDGADSVGSLVDYLSPLLSAAGTAEGSP
jgi:acyl carrier protein